MSLKPGDKVKVFDGSWSYSFTEKGFKHEFGVNLKGEYDVLHSGLTMPFFDELESNKLLMKHPKYSDIPPNDTLIKEIATGKIVSIQERFLRKIEEEPKPDFQIGDWVKVLDSNQSFDLYVTFFAENNLKQFAKNFAAKITTNGESYQIVGIGKHSDDISYGPIYVLQSRDGKIFLMHNGYTYDKEPNPSLELTAAPPKFKAGDKVVPVSKTTKNPFGASSFIGTPEKDPHWVEAKKKCGYLTINQIKGEAFTEANGQYVYDCGNYYCESDLIPYVEPKPKEKPETNMKEKGGYKIGDCVRVYDGLIGHVADLDYCIGVEFKEQISAKSSEWDSRHPDKQGKGYYYLTSDLEPIPSNHCPEPKTIENKVRADGLSRKYVLNGNVTVCIITLIGKQFKGIAKCAPSDEWNERFGMDLAYARARISLWKYRERQLLSK